jgi:hypothetical protein
MYRLWGMCRCMSGGSDISGIKYMQHMCIRPANKAGLFYLPGFKGKIY